MEEERDGSDSYKLKLVQRMLEDRQGERSDKLWKMEVTERWTPGKHGDHLPKTRRLYV
jgi:hypothetical protein